MPINVICPGCHSRFTVADKFAGQKGPCKKCKTIIEIPKLEDQLVIHAPVHSETGAVGAGGQHVLKTFKKQDTKFKPLVFAGVAGIVLLTLLVAILLRDPKHPASYLVLTIGAILLGPPLAWAGYTFLRDDELEGYDGVPLAIRSIACGLVYALCWGVFAFLGDRLFGLYSAETAKHGLEIWQMLVLWAPVLGIATLAAYVSFDLEPGSGFFHAALYFAVTILLRWVIGLAVIPGLVMGK